jgi:hypothetical protein
MKITDHFPMPDQGTVAVGIIAAGSVAVGDTLSVHTADGPLRVTVGAIESDGQSRPGAGVGETVNLLLCGESLEQIAGRSSRARRRPSPCREPTGAGACRPKCEGKMVEGFIGDHTHHNLLVARWMAGRRRPASSGRSIRRAWRRGGGDVPLRRLRLPRILRRGACSKSREQDARRT